MFGAIKTEFRYWNHFFVDRVRDFRRFSLKMLFGRPFRGEKGELQDLRRILVLRLDRKLGDSIASTGFLRALHQCFPQSQITVLTAPETQDVYQGFDFLDVVSVPKGIWPSLKVAWRLRSVVFDVLIDTSHLISPKVVHLAGSLKAKRKIAFKNQDYKMFSDHVDFDEEYDHVTLRYEKTLNLLGCMGADLTYELRIPQENKEKVDQALRSIGAKKIMVVNSFAGAQMRNFREPTTKALLEKLSARFPEHALVSIANRGDMRLLKQWASKWSVPGWVFFEDCTDFYDNCRIIERADLIVSVDTAVVHMACAFKKPIVGVYRAETVRPKGRPTNWDPYGTKFEIVISKPNPEDPEQDINHLNLDEVVVATSRLISMDISVGTW